MKSPKLLFLAAALLVGCDIELPFPIGGGGPSQGGSAAKGGAISLGGSTTSGGTVSTGGSAGNISTGGSSTTGLKWYLSCGEPACRGYTPKSGVSLCTTQNIGDACQTASAQCDPKDDCNALLVCADKDPKVSLGGCPISRKKYKEDIEYLSEKEVEKYADEVLNIKLAHWRYKANPDKRHLGFMIDDVEGSEAVDAKRDMVDLYGYTSMTVAALKSQKREIEALKKQIQLLQAELEQKSAKRQ